MTVGIDQPASGAMWPLTETDIAAFWHDGYLRMPSITTQSEIAWMREAYDRLFTERRGWDKGDMFDFAGPDELGGAVSVPQLLNPSQHEPRLVNTEFRRNALAIARQLLGPKAKLVFEHAMLKPALTGGKTPWHQDEAFYSKYTNYQSLTFWMPLQDVDRSNGCMEFIPGSHKGPLLQHHSINGDPRIHGLEVDGINAALAVPCMLPAGGASIHHRRTLHYAGPNRSAAPRRAYALGFGVRSRALTLREEHSWNSGRMTDRERRERAGRSAAERLIAPIKSVAKSIFR